jgi:hypothetical protein
MADQKSQPKKGGKNLSTSARRKERYSYYKASVYAKNKLKKILRSSGVIAAQQWAKAHQAENVLNKLYKRT